MCETGAATTCVSDTGTGPAMPYVPESRTGEACHTALGTGAKAACGFCGPACGASTDSPSLGVS